MHALISGWNITIPSILSPLPHLRSKLSLQHMSKVALTAMSLFILPFRLNQYLQHRFKAACVWFNSIYQSERIWQTILRSVPLFWSHIMHRPTSCDVILKSSSTLRRSTFKELTQYKDGWSRHYGTHIALHSKAQDGWLALGLQVDSVFGWVGGTRGELWLERECCVRPNTCPPACKPTAGANY